MRPSTPRMVRWPRRVPLSRFKGATPPHAAMRWRLKVPNSGRSSLSVRARTGPMPGTLRDSVSRSRRRDWPGGWCPSPRPGSRDAGRARRYAPGDRPGPAAVRGSGGWSPPCAWPPVAGAGPGEHAGHRSAHQAAGAGWDGLPSKVGQGPRVEPIRLGPLPGGCRTVSRLPGIDDDHRQGSRHQGGNHRPLQAAGRLQHDEHRAHGLELGDEGAILASSFGTAQRSPVGGAQYRVGLWPHQCRQRSVVQTYMTPGGPGRAGCGLMGTGQLYGLWESRT